MPEVKRFINNELPLFHNVEFKPDRGDPFLVTMNAAGQVVERIEMADLSQEECRKLVLKKGFYKKLSSTDKIPEEFMKGPYSEKTDEEVEQIIEKMNKEREEREAKLEREEL